MLMKLHSLQGLRPLITAIIILILSTSFSFSTLASSLGNLETQVAEYESELYTLNQSLIQLAEEIIFTEQQIELSEAAIRYANFRLSNAEIDMQIQTLNMHSRIRFIYETDGFSLLEMLLNAESIAEFINVAEFIQAMSSYDRMMLQELQETHDEIIYYRELLYEEEINLNLAREEMDIKQAELEVLIEETETDLAAFQLQLEVMRGNEAEARLLYDLPIFDISDMEITYEARLLAAIIHTEARGEPLIGQIAVGNVIMNRVADPRFPNTIEEVIRQPRQFCPVGTGAFDATLNNGNYHQNMEAALATLSGHTVVTSDMMFFNSLGFGSVRIGNHWFRAAY